MLRCQIRSRAWVAWVVGVIACGSPKPEQPPASSPRASAPAQALGANSIAKAETEPAQAAPAPQGATAPVAQATDVHKALAYDPADPLADLEAADALDQMAHDKPAANAKAPAGGCAVIEGGRRVWPASGPTAIAALARGFVIAGYATRDGRDQLFVVHLPEDGLPEPITAFDIEPKHPRARTAPPGLAARDDNDISISFTDGAGKLFVRRLRVGRGGTGPAAEIAQGVDTRFAPALTHDHERTLVAWTVGSTPMRVLLAVLSNENAVLSKHDLTPVSMGASAPSFVAGASPPVLLAIDARDGFSPILRVDIGNDGTPLPATVALPLSMVATPPEIAAASSTIGTYVAYAGLGAAATSAVGLVAIAPIAGTPEALVKGGKAYGQLHLAATSAPRAVLVAAEAPLEAGKDARRQIEVRAVGIKGPGPAAVITGSGSATHAALARDGAGNVGLSFSSEGGVYVARLTCDDAS